MPTEPEAAAPANQRPVATSPAFAHPGPAYNRIGAMLVVLSLIAAIGMLHAAFFSDRGTGARASQVSPVAPTATPIMHPMASGVPEAALFLRHRPVEVE
jgi:hypothetical protein